MSSIRARLVLWNAAGITLFLAVGGGVIFGIVRGRMLAEVDRSLSSLAATTSEAIALHLGRAIDLGRPLEEAGELDLDVADLADILFECHLVNGPWWMGSPSLERGTLPRLGRPTPEGALSDVVLANGVRGRALSLSFPIRLPPPRRAGGGRPPRPGPGGLPDRGGPPRGFDPPRPPLKQPAELVIFRDLGAVEETLSELRSLLLITWLLCALGCAGIVAAAVHWNLKPLGRLKEELESVDEQDLTRRFDAEGAPAELVPLITQLNALMQRIEEAFAREQLLTAHTAHELRTPIAGLRTTLELSLARTRSADEYRGSVQAALAMTLSLQHIVDGLLELARAGEGSRVRASQKAVVGDLIHRAWEEHAASAEGRGLTLASRVSPAGSLLTDPELLARVIQNLIENAITYADEGSEIRVEELARSGELGFRVSNRCTGAPPDVAERAFDALWRADSARSEIGSHAGLGLSLCRRILAVLGGSIEAEYSGECFSVSVFLPPAESSP